MNTKKILRSGIAYISILILVGSCSKKLDLFPQNDLTAEKVYATPEGYRQVLAKIYGAMAIGGNKGTTSPDFPDISGGLDQGSQIAFIRMFFNCEELPTDEAICYWNDQTIKAYHNFTYNSDDPFLKGMYARPIWNVTLINEYLRESADDKVAAKGITGTAAADIKASRAEVRFLRAFNYWAMMDIFGKSTFITESNFPGVELPAEISRENLFHYISSELKSMEADLPDPHANEYGRVDRGSAWALMARLHLNANVYLSNTDSKHFDTAITYSKKLLDNGAYTLHTNYSELFMADNDKRTNEIVWAIACDGLQTQGYGNTTFLVNAGAGEDKPADYFANAGGAGWKGYTATKGLVEKFEDPSGATDKRAMFTTTVFSPSAEQVEMKYDPLTVNESIFDSLGSGVHVNKYRNIRSDGLPIQDQVNFTFADVDFPVFRLAEMYLVYAEAVLRGGAGGDLGQALQYINDLRARAYGNHSQDITSGELTLDFVLNERSRELYWEGHRRTDLVRYGHLISSTYVWPWKGGVKDGRGVDNKYNLFPIPATARNSNPNLSQNPGF